MIVVSRDIVPVSLCDLEIGICNRRIPGTLIYLGLIAVVTVDKDLLHAGLTAPRFSDRILKIGDEIEDFGLDAAEQLNRKKTHIKDIGSVGSLVPIPPRWAMRNIEGIYIQEYMPSKGGVFIDPEDKSIVALSLSVNYQGNVGISYPFYVRPIIAALERGETIMPRSAGWSFFPSNLAGCLELGLREERAIRMVKLAKAQNALPRPISICARLRPLPNDGRDTLQIGDILIEINDVPVIRMADLHVLTQVESAKILVSRAGQELLLTIPTYELPSEWTDKILFWEGAILHRTHEAVLELITPEFAEASRIQDFTDPASGVYMSSFWSGSPGAQIPNTQWIIEVDGHKIRDMNDMLRVVEKLKGRAGDHIRVKILHRSGTTDIGTIRLDSKFWPSYTLEQKDGKWVRTELE